MSEESILDMDAVTQECRRILENRGVAHLQAELRRLLDNTPHGVFRADGAGRFISVNQAFAVMLGYDAPSVLLAERPSIADLCAHPDEGQAMLAALKDHPGQRCDAIFVQRGGVPRNFFILSLQPLPLDPLDEDAPECVFETVDGFLLDRTVEEQALLARQQRDRAVRQSASLALLLASISRQSQEYLIPGHHVSLPPEDEGCALPTPGEAPPGPMYGAKVEACDLFARMGGGEERRKGSYSLNAVFDDIYRIAVAEAEGALPVAVHIDLDRLMDSLCLQALPAMQSKGIDLYRDIEAGLVRRFSGLPSLLRHAMLRALLAVTAPVHGGRACVSVTRDRNTPRAPGSSRLIFSVSWTGTEPDTQRDAVHAPDEGDTPGYGQGASPQAVRTDRYPKGDEGDRYPKGDEGEAGENAQSGGTNDPALSYCTPDFVNDPALLSCVSAKTPRHGKSPRIMDGMSLNITEERSVITFLVRKMNGDLLDAVLTGGQRSISFVVQLGHVELGAEDVAAARAGQDEAPGPAPGMRYSGDEDLQTTPDDPDCSLDGCPLSLIDMEPDAAVTDQPRGEGLDILLVSDNPDNRMTFSLYLRDANHRITEAHDGQAGVEAFQRRKFDVIFMDMEMPFMGGYQATRIIRALEGDAGLPPTPVVAQSSHVLPEFKQQCFLSGCSEFLARPFTQNALLAMLEAIAQLKVT